MENKFGEIILNKDGSVTLKGYRPKDRDVFEFVELSEYYKVIKAVQNIADAQMGMNKALKDLLRALV